MNIFRPIRAAIALMLIVAGGLVACVSVIWQEISREVSFRRQFGDGWQIEYENVFGSLTQAHTRLITAIVGPVLILSIVAWLYRRLRAERQGTSDGHRSRRRHRHVSTMERIIRCRRNAIVGICFGIAGILTGMALVLIPFGLFADPENEVVLAIFVFTAGYIAVLTGCCWWARAKAWNDAVVLIGLLPLVIMFIPFVRLIFLVQPALLILGMVVMPVVLIVVVFTLPDKSGAGGRNRRR